MENLLRSFLANLGASNINVCIKHEIQTTKTRGTDVAVTTGGGVEGLGSGKVDVDVKTNKKNGGSDIVEVAGVSERNEANLSKAEEILKKSAWLKQHFEDLYGRVKNGQVKGKEGTSITHVTNEDYMSNLKTAVGVAAKYKLVSSEVRAEMQHSVEKHKKEKVTLNWSCDFAKIGG